MKFLLILSLSLFAVNSFAGAVDDLTSVLSVGTHHGKNDRGNCSVSVKEVSFPKKGVNVTVAEAADSVSKLVQDDSDYRFVVGQKRFIQSVRTDIGIDGASYDERTIATRLAEDNTLYVVTSHVVQKNTDTVVNEVAECVIDL